MRFSLDSTATILSRLGTTAVFFGYWGHGSEVKKNWREPAASPVAMETVSEMPLLENADYSKILDNVPELQNSSNLIKFLCEADDVFVQI